MEDVCQILKDEETYARKDLERIRSSAQATTRKSENIGATSCSMKKENHRQNQQPCKK